MLEKSLEILKKIESFGYKAYIVGGFARDFYIGRNSADVDICTNAKPNELRLIFKDNMLPSENYGSVALTYKKVRFEITTFREDVKYENYRQPVEIKYIDTLSEDLKRRDFVINTLCINSDGEFVDLLNAMKDCDEKIIRAVGSSKYKLKEDVLRILRAVRFATTLNFRLESQLEEYIKKYAVLLKKLSYNRKKEELEKIFASRNAEYGIKLILELGLDKPLELKNLSKVIPTTSSIGIWAQLNVENIYNFSNHEREMMTNIWESYKEFNLENKTLYRLGLYVVSIAAEIKKIDKNMVTEMYMNLPIKSREDIALSGNQICTVLGIEPSKLIKTIYDDMEDKILNGELKNNEEVLIEYIKKTYAML